MSKLTPVTFTKAWRGYSAGEIAGFTAEQAQALIDGGVATQPGQPPAKAKAAPVKAGSPVPAADPVVVEPDDEKP
ncbi:hypothetical protein [Azotobacter vinelandii]